MPEKDTSAGAALAAVRAAVERSPGDTALRTHLADLLFESGDIEAAKRELDLILGATPDSVEALALAASVADALGDPQAAAGYRRLAAALSKSTSASAEEDGQPTVVKLHAVRGPDVGAGEIAETERPTLTLDDVHGMEHVKRRLRTSFIAPMENPALRRMYGKSLRGGLLLYGPPGCGKTFIARATAGELGAKFIAVGLHDVLDMWLGESEKNLHQLFESARRAAPCVLFFDELDALGRKRTQLRHSAGREVVVQFLAELDSFGSDNEGVFVLGATNHPWDVDSALRRPGRFDRMVLVVPPDAEARAAILAFHLRDRPVDEAVELDAIASATEMYSGADLAHLCESAAEYALENALSTGSARPIIQEDFERALQDVRASTVAWLQTARNFAQFSSEGGIFDDLLEYLRQHRLA
jgi:SpoVK/Ycf46/Vps4 family AAA+-type ATPase